MFSCEFCETFKNIFFTEHFQATFSVINIGANDVQDSNKYASQRTSFFVPVPLFIVLEQVFSFWE